MKRKKNRIGIIVIVCVLVVSFVLGVTGAVTFAKDRVKVDDAAISDRLIGVYITTKDPKDEKIYAKLVNYPGENAEGKRYVFEGIDGWAFYHAEYKSERGLSYGESYVDDYIFAEHIGVGSNLELKGSIYLSADRDFDMLYFNPIFQTPNGEVYLSPAWGEYIGYNSSWTSSLKTSLNRDYTITEDGKKKTFNTSVDMDIYILDTPISTSIIQFDKDGNVLDKDEYKQDKLPSSISTAKGTEYIIVENYMKSKDGKESISRDMVQNDNNSLYAFICLDNGICTKKSIKVEWK